MMYIIVILVVKFIVGSSYVMGAQYEAPIATLQPLCPRGLRIGIPDSPEIRFVGFHININNPLNGATPSEYSADLGRPLNGLWQFEIPDIYLQKGDQIHYWMHMIHDGLSLLKTDLSWIMPELPCENSNRTSFQCKPSITRIAKGPVCSGQLLFDEEFNHFNLETWQHEISASGGKHHEFQIYVNNRSNSFARDGVLHIRPSLTVDVHGEEFLYNGILDLRGVQCTNPSNNGCHKRAVGAQILNPIMSAQIQTVESFSFQYGIVKVRAKMPRGDWLWPSIFLLPRRNSYGDWPRSGQMTLAQSRGNMGFAVDGESLGSDRVEMLLTFGTHGLFIKKHVLSESRSRWDEAFHEYQLEWMPDRIQFSVDNNVVMNSIPPPAGGFWTSDWQGNVNKSNIYRFGSNMAPFDQQFYIAISLAVGGVSDFFPDQQDNAKPWNNTSPSAVYDFWERKDQWYPSWQMENADFEIDYIRVWALP